MRQWPRQARPWWSGAPPGDGTSPPESVYLARALILVAGALVCCYALGVLGYVLATPDVGLRCAFSPRVIRVYPGYLRPPGLPLPNLEGVTIVRFGGKPIRTWPDLLRAVTDIREEAPTDVLPADARPGPNDEHVQIGDEEWVRVSYRRPDAPTVQSSWLLLGYPPLEVLLPGVLWFVLTAGLAAVGAFVYWKRPHDRPAAQFFLLCVVTLGAYTGGYHWSRIMTQPVLLLVFIVCSVLLPAVTLHFYLMFPRPKSFYQKHPHWTLLAVYGVPVLFLVTMLHGYFLVRSLYGKGDYDHLLEAIKFQIYVYFGVAVAWYVASFGCLLHSFRSARDVTERNQVKWILWGLGAAFVPIGYTLYLAFFQPDDFGSGSATWPMFAASACVTAAFTVSITRYRLMHLDQLVSTGVVYVLASSLAGLIYYVVVFAGMWLFNQWIAGPSPIQALGVSSAALVLIVVVDRVRSFFARAMDRRFFRDKNQLDRTLLRMRQAIEQLVDPPTLARRLLRESAELLGVTRGAVYLRDGRSAIFRLADHLGPTPALTELPPGCPLVESLRGRGPLPSAETNGHEGPAMRQLRLLGGELAHPLTHEGELLALLVLGPKGEGPYSSEDLTLLAAFAQITVLALVSAEGHQTIETLNRELQAKVEKIAEQQRRILALQSQLEKVANGEWRVPREPAAEAMNGKAAEESAAGEPLAARPAAPGGIVGSSAPVQELLQLVRKVSDSQATVLIRGESGTGKELLAQALHDHSPRAGKAFVKVHCAALSAGLLESELFGHVKGAFTGAHRDKVGRFELAHGGTLFLDEIGDISLEVQTKLLRVLQERTFERVGSSEPVRVDVRLIAATHQNLEQLIRDGRFREDLYYRLNVISIHMPPLRDRREDIPELAAHFLRLHAARCGRDVTQIDDDALAALKAYPWPGNIRQLENVIERAVVVAEDATITCRELPPDLREEPPTDGLDAGWVTEAAGEGGAVAGGIQGERVERYRREREQLVRALAATSGNKAEAARILGMARSTLISRLKKHGLQ